MNHPLFHVVVGGAALSFLMAHLCCQENQGIRPISPFPTIGPGGTVQQPQDPRSGALGRGTAEGFRGFMPSARSPYAEGFQGIESALPPFQGFPSAGVQVPGFGGYPGGGLLTPPGGVPRAPFPSLSPRRAEGWPSWIKLPEQEEPLLNMADGAVLVRSSDRVWLRDPREKAFVPLAYYDKFRMLVTGSEVRVRDGGEFTLLFHDAARLASTGPADLRFTALNTEGAEFLLREITTLWLEAKDRPMVVRFENGSALRLANGRIYLRRTDLPSGVRRVEVQNQGRTVVEMTMLTGATNLPPAHRLDLLLSMPLGLPLDAALMVHGGVTIRREGRLAVAEGGGEVVWSGVQFKLRDGQHLVLDPLLGKDFPIDPIVRPVIGDPAGTTTPPPNADKANANGDRAPGRPDVSRQPDRE